MAASSQASSASNRRASATPICNSRALPIAPIRPACRRWWTRVLGWNHLADHATADQRKLAVILSTYPGRPDQIAHAVGLDALASTEALTATLAAARLHRSAG